VCREASKHVPIIRILITRISHMPFYGLKIAVAFSFVQNDFLSRFHMSHGYEILWTCT
jgi:hypothetical protein